MGHLKAAWMMRAEAVSRRPRAPFQLRKLAGTQKHACFPNLQDKPILQSLFSCIVMVLLEMTTDRDHPPMHRQATGARICTCQPSSLAACKSLRTVSASSLCSMQSVSRGWYAPLPLASRIAYRCTKGLQHTNACGTSASLSAGLGIMASGRKQRQLQCRSASTIDKDCPMPICQGQLAMGAQRDSFFVPQPCYATGE